MATRQVPANETSVSALAQTLMMFPEMARYERISVTQRDVVRVDPWLFGGGRGGTVLLAESSQLGHGESVDAARHLNAATTSKLANRHAIFLSGEKDLTRNLTRHPSQKNAAHNLKEAKWLGRAAILCTGGPLCDPKGSMVFLQNKVQCPPMLGARRT